jgi:hypothetical protein
MKRIIWTAILLPIAWVITDRICGIKFDGFLTTGLHDLVYLLSGAILYRNVIKVRDMIPERRVTEI